MPKKTNAEKRKGEENYKPIGGTYIETNYWYDSLKKVDLDV